MKLKISLFCFVLFFVLEAFAVPTSSDVHEYTLNNGLRLIVKEDHRAPVVVNYIWYRVGSSYEPFGLTGISHIVEHMMFKGTPTYPDGSFSRIMAQNGAVENAMTYYDFTAYYQKLAADKLPLAFKMEADRMENLILNEKDFSKEIEVIKEERRMRTDNVPQMLTYERFMALAYTAEPYHNPVVGWPSDLQTVKVDDLKKWYKTWYAPNNAIVVVVGDVNPDKVKELAEQYFGNLKPSVLPEVKAIREIASLGQRESVVKAPARLPVLIMGYNTVSAVTATVPWEPYALEVLSGILDGGESGRLTRHLVREKQVASAVQTSYDLYSRLSGLLAVLSIPGLGHKVPELKTSILAEIKNLQDNLVDANELKRVKAQVIANNIFQQDSLTYQGELIGSLETVGLSWKEIDNYQKQVEAVTAEQIQQVAKKYLNPDQLIVTTLEAQPINEHATTEEEGVNNAAQDIR